MSNEGMQAAFKDLQDSIIVMAHVETRRIRNRSEEAKLAEITDKLNRLTMTIKGKIES
jgi:hypothetical protein